MATGIPNMGYVTPSGWPPLEERILTSVIQGLTANMAIDQTKPSLIASKALEITEAIVERVTGQKPHIVYDHSSQQLRA